MTITYIFHAGFEFLLQGGQLHFDDHQFLFLGAEFCQSLLLFLLAGHQVHLQASVPLLKVLQLKHTHTDRHTELLTLAMVTECLITQTWFFFFFVFFLI